MTAGRRAKEFRACGVWGEMTDRGFEKILAIHGITAFSDGFFDSSGHGALSLGAAAMIDSRSLAGKRFYSSCCSDGKSAPVDLSRATSRMSGLSDFEPSVWTKLLWRIGGYFVDAPIERNGRNRLPC